jgi:hypothetical protein
MIYDLCNAKIGHRGVGYSIRSSNSSLEGILDSFC